MKIQKTCKNCGKIRFFYPKEIQSRPLDYCKKCKRFTNRTHGESKTRLYALWSSMNNRCSIPSDTNYIRYGAKGIKVCNEWHTYLPFRNWALKNGYTNNLTLDRIENSKGYYPLNCRWIPRADQMRNMTTN